MIKNARFYALSGFFYFFKDFKENYKTVDIATAINTDSDKYTEEDRR